MKIITKIYYKKILTCFFIMQLFISCKTTEIPKEIFFDYSQLSKITFSTNSVEIQNAYQPMFNEPYLDHLAPESPTHRLSEWIKNNIKGFGIKNKLVILIKEASIVSSEIDPDSKIAGVIKKPKELKYELNYDVLYLIYDDTEKVLGKASVKVNRTTTSSKLISLYERDRILDDLIYNSLDDLVNKSKDSINKYLSKYIL